MTGCATEIHETALGQQENFVGIRERVLVHLWFDVGSRHAFGCVERIDLNLVIEMADVGDDGLIFHPLHVFQRDDIDVAAGGNVDVSATERLFDGSDFVTFHRRLKRVDRIDLGNNDPRALTA